MEINQNLEGKKTDNLEVTSASETTAVDEGNKQDNPTPELNNSVAPTQNEVEDASLKVAPENVVPNGQTVDTNPVAAEPNEPNLANPESDQSSTPAVEGENVTPVVEQSTSENLVHEENGVTDSPAMKTFTQEELNDIVGKTRTETRNKTREETFNYIYNRYGVNDEAGLDEVVGNAQRYDSLNEQYEGDKKVWKESSDASAKQLADLSEQVALMQSGIDSSRYEDAKFILKGKGLDVTLENIKTELGTHPEWAKKDNASEANPNFVKTGEPNIPQKPAEPETKLSVLGNDSNAQFDDEEARAMKLFKV